MKKGVIMNKILNACPLCNGMVLKKLAVPGHWIGEDCFEAVKDKLGINKCRTCGFIFINPRPCSDLLNAFYSGDTYECHDADFSPSKTGVAEYIFGALKHFCGNKQEGRVLDFGCGGGFLLSFLRDQGWSAIGYDVGPAALQSCREQGFSVVSDLHDIDDASVSAVVMSHVVEHLEDPGSTLHHLKRLLAPRGRVFIATPNVTSLRCRLSPRLFSRHLNFDERYRAFPIHLSYFSTRTLPLLLRSHGFAVEAVLTHGLGLEELVRAQPSPTGAHRPQVRHRRHTSALKALIKELYFRSGLGENLMVVGGLNSDSATHRPLRHVEFHRTPSS